MSMLYFIPMHFQNSFPLLVSVLPFPSYKKKVIVLKCIVCLFSFRYSRSVDNIEKYKVAKKTAKRAVSMANDRAYEDIY